MLREPLATATHGAFAVTLDFEPPALFTASCLLVLVVVEGFAGANVVVELRFDSLKLTPDLLEHRGLRRRSGRNLEVEKVFEKRLRHFSCGVYVCVCV